MARAKGLSRAEIRADHRAGMSVEDLAERHGCSRRSIKHHLSAKGAELLPWTTAEIEEMQQLAPTGIGAAGIAVKLGRTVMSVKSKANKLRIAIAAPASAPLIDIPFPELRAARLAGTTITALAATYGVSIATIDNRLAKMGMTRPHPGKPPAAAAPKPTMAAAPEPEPNRWTAPDVNLADLPLRECQPPGMVIRGRYVRAA